MNGDEGEEDWSSRTQWWQKSLCVWGLWLSTVDSKRFDLKLTMAHNQDRLQNSDSSVVYGHGHIIYSHTARTGRQQAVQAGDAQAPRRLAAAFSEAIASHSLTWATHHYDKPSNSQLWVWMALLKNTSQSISWRNVHFCIRSYSTLHTVYCGALTPPPKLRIAPLCPSLLQWKFINSPLFFVSVQVIVATTVSTSMQFGHIWVTYWVSHYNINQFMFLKQILA